MPSSHLSKDRKIDLGFPKITRLLTADEYSRVFANAKAFRDPLFTLLARTNQAESARLGLVIPKKNVNLSVQRNRVKRIARESFRLQREHLPSVDIVLIARQGMGRADNRSLQQAFQRQWQKMSRFYTSEKSSTTQAGSHHHG